jgi:cysteine synthase
MITTKNMVAPKKDPAPDKYWADKLPTIAVFVGNNLAGSVKYRPALSMTSRDEARAEFKPGDTLIEATSGTSG